MPGPASELPARIDAVLLDAGGVLLDLDYAYLRRLIEARHGEVAPTELSRAEAAARRHVERQVRAGGRVSSAWRDYFHTLLGEVGVPGRQHDEIIDALWQAHQRVGLWTVAIEGAVDTVTALRRAGYRMGVVSNAEGRVERDLDGAGYRGMFETVVDSSLVGVEKPDPRIFEIALEKMDLRAETTVYVGDLPAVDLAGARAAGLAPILLDRHDLYPEESPRIHSIDGLLGLLGPRI